MCALVNKLEVGCLKQQATHSLTWCGPVASLNPKQQQHFQRLQPPAPPQLQQQGAVTWPQFSTALCCVGCLWLCLSCRSRRGTVCWWQVRQQAAAGSPRRASSHAGGSSHWRTRAQHSSRWERRGEGNCASASLTQERRRETHNYLSRLAAAHRERFGSRLLKHEVLRHGYCYGGSRLCMHASLRTGQEQPSIPSSGRKAVLGSPCGGWTRLLPPVTWTGHVVPRVTPCLVPHVMGCTCLVLICCWVRCAAAVLLLCCRCCTWACVAAAARTPTSFSL